MNNLDELREAAEQAEAHHERLAMEARDLVTWLAAARLATTDPLHFAVEQSRAVLLDRDVVAARVAAERARYYYDAADHADKMESDRLDRMGSLIGRRR